MTSSLLYTVYEYGAAHETRTRMGETRLILSQIRIPIPAALLIHIFDHPV